MEKMEAISLAEALIIIEKENPGAPVQPLMMKAAELVLTTLYHTCTDEDFKETIEVFGSSLYGCDKADN